jgi:two-component system chemotaxis sensor kinase CheA
MAGPVDLQEFVVGFVVEAEEYLDSVNRNLVAVAEALTQNRAEPRAVRELFRSLHTIKGLAAMIAAEPIVAVAHEMETILRNAERDGGHIPDRLLDLLVQGTRAIEERVQVTSTKGVAAIPAAPANLIEALAAAQISASQIPARAPSEISIPEEILKHFSLTDREQVVQAFKAGRHVVQIDFHPSTENAARGLNITSVRERLGALGEIIKVVPRSSRQAPTGILFSLIVATDAAAAALAEASGTTSEAIQYITVLAPSGDGADNSAAAAVSPAPLPNDVSARGPSPEGEAFDLDVVKDWAPTDQSSVRVDIRRLDETLERLGELVVTRSKLARVAADMHAKGVDTRDLNAVLAENTRQLKRLRGAITKARMVPLAELFQRLPLVVRGLAKNSDKAVNLVVKVGLSEVDKAVADKIFPAVVHLIRNSFDHAVESKAERVRLGKPEVATISVISDDSSGTNLILTLSDDGRGIDREAVARKSGRPIAHSDDELLQQIALPGLSTADQVSTTSGRGMGMDIVQRTIETLGGRLSLKTEPGRGTVFTLNVPVSVTIVDVLSFVSGDQVFAVPLATVEEIIEVEPHQLSRTPATFANGVEVQLIQRRGLPIPLLSLTSLLYRQADTHTEDPAARLAVRTNTRALVVNQLRGGAVAFGIDRLLGQQEVVVRPVQDTLVRVKGLAGATDLGDGRPTLVLDLSTMGTHL